MVNPAELDTRLMSHAARVDAANRYGAMLPAQRRVQDGPGSFVLHLRHLSARLAHGQLRQTRGGTSAA